MEEADVTYKLCWSWPFVMCHALVVNGGGTCSELNTHMCVSGNMQCRRGKRRPYLRFHHGETGH